MLFSELVEAEFDHEMRPIIDSLLKSKVSTPEITEGARIDALNGYIEDATMRLEKERESIPYEEKQPWRRLDELFLKALQESKDA